MQSHFLFCFDVRCFCYLLNKIFVLPRTRTHTHTCACTRTHTHTHTHSHM